MSAMGAAGCASSDPTAESAPPEPVATVEQKFASRGIERVIPLRIVMMADDCTNPQPQFWCSTPLHQSPPNACTTCSDGSANCGPNTANFADIRTAVERANWALAQVGVQVYIQRIEKYVMPTFWKTTDSSPGPIWSTVRDQLQRVYPNLPSNAWPDGWPMKSERNWLHAATLRGGDPREIILWVAECSYGWDGARATEGPSSMKADRELFWHPRGLAHEIGHVIGLEHTMYPERAAGINPEKQQDQVLDDRWDYWDLEFGTTFPGGGTTFFTTREQAKSFARQPGNYLFAKHIWTDSPDHFQNCSLDANTCTLSCNINGVPVVTGDPGIAGLAFTYAGDNPGAGVYRRGANSMMYIDEPPGFMHSSPFCEWTSFSDSEAEQVKRILRSDIRIAGYDWAYEDGHTAQRFKLGETKTISGFDQLDFDGDNLRDIAVWQPPDTPVPGSPGRFRALLSNSSPAYSGTLTRDFGLSGDVPVPADYDGDGKTDFAVVRRGGLNAQDPFDSQLWWLWCKSSASHDCTNYGSFQWGYQYDVPLPGLEFDGNTSTKEVAVYRPSDSYVYWHALVGSAWGAIYTGNLAGGRPLPIVHLHGLYDNDNKTDLAFYEPIAARFDIFLSTRGWSDAQKVSRWFDSVLFPDALGATEAGTNAPAMRHGGIPLVAEKNGRRVLRVWDTYTGNWHTNWNPIGSTSIQSCPYGGPRDIPLAGPIDRNLDGFTDIAFYRPTGSMYSHHVLVRSINDTSCILGTAGVQISPASPRLVPMAVRDMAGSAAGRGSFLFLDPEHYSWIRLYSQTNGTFVAQPALSLGDVGAMGL